MTLIDFMELLRNEGFTAEEMFSVICEVNKQRIESAKFTEIMKFVTQLKKERVERRKFDPYDQ